MDVLEGNRVDKMKHKYLFQGKYPDSPKNKSSISALECYFDY